MRHSFAGIQAFGRLSLIVAATVSATACFQSSTVLKVKADGSGTIEQRTLLTDAAIDQLRAFTILGGGTGRDIDPLSEEQARSLAAAIGPGVTYLSSTPVRTPGAQGRESLYAFSDVTRLRISQQPQIPGGVAVQAPGLNTATDPITFGLTRQEDGNILLRILVPRLSGLPLGAPGANGSISPPSPDQIAMVKQVLAGARLSVVVEPEGHVLRTSSPYVDGERVTLLDIDVYLATKDPALLDQLQTAKTLEEARTAVRGVPGLKINLDPEITIEFTPAK